MDGAREHYAKPNKSVREGQIPYDFTHKWNLRKKAKGKEREGQTKKQTLK